MLEKDRPQTQPESINFGDSTYSLPSRSRFNAEEPSFKDKAKEAARTATVSALGTIRRFMEAGSETIGKIADDLSQSKPAPAAAKPEPPRQTNPAARVLDIETALRDINAASQGVLDHATRTNGNDAGSITREVERLTESLDALAKQRNLDPKSMEEREASINEARARLIEAEKQFSADVLGDLIGKTWGNKES